MVIVFSLLFTLSETQLFLLFLIDCIEIRKERQREESWPVMQYVPLFNLPSLRLEERRGGRREKTPSGRVIFILESCLENEQVPLTAIATRGYSSVFTFVFTLITQKLKWAYEQEILFPLQVYICGEENILFLFYLFCLCMASFWTKKNLRALCSVACLNRSSSFILSVYHSSLL